MNPEWPVILSQQHTSCLQIDGNFNASEQSSTTQFSSSATNLDLHEMFRDFLSHMELPSSSFSALEP